MFMYVSWDPNDTFNERQLKFSRKATFIGIDYVVAVNLVRLSFSVCLEKVLLKHAYMFSTQ